ncbi:MAG: type I-C CRISPR-associated protein Cas8c/Csd1 [Ruminococcus sp.]|nr:type I-C CRISPR-associated protein Cas8c/Csd1 [Ruminococcus sp.]
MSWTNELYNVYEKNCGNPNNVPMLLPISHSTANAQIEVTLNENGDFVQADAVDKNNAETVFPVTQASIAKAGSGAIPHPFAESLLYIAGDYGKYFNSKHSKEKKYFEAYISQLKKWAASEYSHKAVKAVLAYLEKKQITRDIIDSGVLTVNENTIMLSEKKINEDAAEKLFVRFKINYADFLSESRTWKDKTLYDSFIEYSASGDQNSQLCYATGKVLPVTYKHPYGIIKTAPKGKLISANDESGFAYRGRFQNKEQAISVSYDFSQKMHNALKWLIAKQGINIENSLTLVVWESAMRKLPNITDSSQGFIFEDEAEESKYADTYAAYKDLLQKSLFGYKNRFDDDPMAMVMGLDSATTGRLSICIYSELQSSVFLENVKKWHEDTAWFCYNEKQREYVYDSFSLRNIINCAFGTEQGKFIECGNSKLSTDYVCRLIPCVTEGRKLPSNIVSALVSKASCPLKYDKSYNWRNVLNTACGMLRKKMIENKEECKMALDEKRADRSYLYGRLLAVADAAEASTYDNDEKRTTNAKRYFEAFSNRPYSTWNIIRKRLSPYLEKHDKANKSVYSENYYSNLINTVTDMFDADDFEDNSKLEPIYLHAYSCQMKKLSGGRKENTNTDTNTEEE